MSAFNPDGIALFPHTRMSELPQTKMSVLPRARVSLPQTRIVLLPHTSIFALPQTRTSAVMTPLETIDSPAIVDDGSVRTTARVRAAAATPLRRPVRGERADGDRARGVPGRNDPGPHGRAVRQPPESPRRRHLRNPRPHGALHRLAHRIVPIRLQVRRAQRQVDHADVVVSLVI